MKHLEQRFPIFFVIDRTHNLSEFFSRSSIPTTTTTTQQLIVIQKLYVILFIISVCKVTHLTFVARGRRRGVAISQVQTNPAAALLSYRWFLVQNEFSGYKTFLLKYNFIFHNNCNGWRIRRLIWIGRIFVIEGYIYNILQFWDGFKHICAYNEISSS